jgi:hypothetical protein
VDPNVPVLDLPGLVTLDTWYLFIAGFGFLPQQDGIKVFNVKPARVIPALGKIR